MIKRLSVVKKEMLEYAKEVVDLEPGESPKDWVDVYIAALKEDGKIIHHRGILYVID